MCVCGWARPLHTLAMEILPITYAEVDFRTKKNKNFQVGTWPLAGIRRSWEKEPLEQGTR